MCVGGSLTTCQILFLEHDSKDSRAGMCSWNNVKQTGHPPLPSLGASRDMHVRETLPHTALHLLLALFEQNGHAGSRGRARPLLSVGLKTPPPLWYSAQSVSGTHFGESNSQVSSITFLNTVFTGFPP